MIKTFHSSLSIHTLNLHSNQKPSSHGNYQIQRSPSIPFTDRTAENIAHPTPTYYTHILHTYIYLQLSDSDACFTLSSPAFSRH